MFLSIRLPEMVGERASAAPHMHVIFNRTFLPFRIARSVKKVSEKGEQAIDVQKRDTFRMEGMEGEGRKEVKGILNKFDCDD